MSVLADVRYALRSLRRQPTFTAVAVLTLVLGIGANTAIFSVIKAVLLNQLPYRDPGRLVVLSEQSPDGNPDLVAGPTYRRLARPVPGDSVDRGVPLAALRVCRQRRAAERAQRARDAESVRAAWRQSDCGTQLPRRRGTARHRSRRHAQPRFLAAALRRLPAVIGRTIQLDAQPYTDRRRDAGDFDFPPGGTHRRLDAAQFRSERRARPLEEGASLSVVGRLADGVALEQAQREMTLLASRLATTYPDSNTGWGVRVIAAQQQLVTTVRPALLLITGAVGFLLLIVCANVANLILARLSSRRGELAVRAALGAGRWQLVRQVLVESVVLALDRRRARPVRGVGRRAIRPFAARGQPAAHAGRTPRRAASCCSRSPHRWRSHSCPGSFRHCTRLAAGCATRCNAFSRRRRADRASAAWRARRRRSGAGAGAARRRRADDAQLRRADARVARLRAAQSAGGADLSAAGEVPDRRSIGHASTRTRCAASARCRACSRRPA